MCCVLLGTCDGGIFTYEKTTGHFLRTAQQDPLDLQGQKMPGITVRCSNACSDLGSECPAFTVDYSGQRCFKLDRYGRYISRFIFMYFSRMLGHYKCVNSWSCPVRYF